MFQSQRKWAWNAIRRSLLWVSPVLMLSMAPQKAAAQWKVFDPSSYAIIGKVWSSDLSMNIKMAQTIAQGSQLISQGMQIYGLARQEASFFAKGQIIQGIGFAAQHAQIPGHASWDVAMTSVGGIANAGLAWQQMTNPHLSLQNRIALMNSFATSAINSIGNCNAAACQNGTAMGGLASIGISMAGPNNTASSQRNLMNTQQALRYQQCEKNLAEQRVKLELVRVQEAQDRDQRSLNISTNLAQYNAANAGEWNISPEEDISVVGGMH